MGTLIFYQANEHSAWTLLPLLGRKPLDSNDQIRLETPKKLKRPPLFWRGGCRLRNRRFRSAHAWTRRHRGFV